MNFAAVDAAVGALKKVDYPKKATSKLTMPPIVSEKAPEFVQNVTAEIIAGRGEELPGFGLPGRRHLSHRHDAVREAQHRGRHPGLGAGSLHPVQHLLDRLSARRHPTEGFREGMARQGARRLQVSIEAMTKSLKGKYYALQVAPEDCTGCEVCVNACPAFEKDENKATRPSLKAINMAPQAPLRAQEARNWDFFINELPDTGPSLFNIENDQGLAVRQAAVRVLRGLFRLRRDRLRQADDTALRRPRHLRQRHRL